MIKLIAIYLILTAFYRPLFADESHQRDIIPGGRAAMMGGAYTALSDDPSGLFHNPAGTAFSGYNKFTANGTAFFDKKTTYHHAIEDGDFVQITKATFPSFIGGLYTFGRAAVSYGVLTLDHSETKQNNYFTGITNKPNFAEDYSRFHQESIKTALYGAGLSYKLSQSLSAGLTTIYVNRSLQATIHQQAKFSSGQVINIDQSYGSEHFGGGLAAGLTFKGKAFSVGLSYRSYRSINETAELSQDYIDYRPDNNEETQIIHSQPNEFKLDYKMPDTAQAGVSWKPRNWLLLALDILYHQGLEYGNSQVGIKELENTINIALGLELKLAGLLLRAGAFSNQDMTKEIDRTKRNQADHVDYIGQSFGLGYRIKDYASYIGYISQTGKGYAQKIQGELDVQEVSSKSNLFLISLNYFL